MSRRLVVSLALLMAVLGRLSQAADPPGEDEVLVSGKGIKITRSALEDDFRRILHAATEQQQVIPEEKRDAIRAALLEQRVFIVLTTNRAMEVEIKRAIFEADQFIKAEKKKAGSPEAFRQSLLSQGATEEQLREQNYREVLSRTVVEREVNGQIKIPSSDIKAYYEENPSRWENPEKIQVAQIFFSLADPQSGAPLPAAQADEKKNRATTALERAKKGGDFAALVREYSEDADSKARGGTYTVIRGQISKDLEDASFALQPGELSGVVKSEFGYHILKLISKTPARKMALEEVEPQIRELITQRDLKVRIPEYSSRIRKEAQLAYSTNAPRIPIPGL